VVAEFARYGGAKAGLTYMICSQGDKLQNSHAMFAPLGTDSPLTGIALLRRMWSWAGQSRRRLAQWIEKPLKWSILRRCREGAVLGQSGRSQVRWRGRWLSCCVASYGVWGWAELFRILNSAWKKTATALFTSLLDAAGTLTEVVLFRRARPMGYALGLRGAYWASVLVLGRRCMQKLAFIFGWDPWDLQYLPGCAALAILLHHWLILGQLPRLRSVSWASGLLAELSAWALGTGRA